MDTGARTYIPAIGRFTSVDSVENGNANAYVYPGDPVNNSDLNGNLSSAFPEIGAGGGDYEISNAVCGGYQIVLCAVDGDEFFGGS
jgi:hypothetical protein